MFSTHPYLLTLIEQLSFGLRIDVYQTDHIVKYRSVVYEYRTNMPWISTESAGLVSKVAWNL